MNKRILVIGNGFDLAQGYKTHYCDFVSFTKSAEEIKDEKIKKICSENPFIKHFQKMEKLRNWIDVEKEIAEICCAFSECLKLLDKGDVKPAFDRRNITKRNINVIESFSTYFSTRGDYYWLNEKFGSVLNKDKVIDSLRNELEEVIETLAYYLDSEVNRLKKKDITIPQAVMGIKYDYVINFNYTSTFRNLGVEDVEMHYVHGKTSDCKSMVLGMPGDLCEDIDFIYFKKYFQRIQKHNKNIDTSKIVGGILPDDCSITYIFGLSLGKNDSDIIKEILDNSGEVIIYYKDQKDYEMKLLNLFDTYENREFVENKIFGDDWKFKRIVKKEED